MICSKRAQVELTSIQASLAFRKGVATIIKQRAALFAQRGLQFDLKYVSLADPYRCTLYWLICLVPLQLVVKDVKRSRDFEIPASAVVTDNHDLVLHDDAVDMVVEVMGGLDAAHKVCRPGE